MVEEHLRRVALLQQAVAEHGHALAERHGLDLVVGDVDRRHAEALVQARELGAHRDAELGVEVGERLVHEVRGGLAHHGAPHRDALALAAGELAGLAVEQLVEAEDLRDVVHAPVDLGLGRLAHLQAERQVLAHGHVRVERVVLEHHRDVAGAGRGVGDVAAADPTTPSVTSSSPAIMRRASTCHSPTGRRAP